jgi:hypothetical protein
MGHPVRRIMSVLLLVLCTVTIASNLLATCEDCDDISCDGCACCFLKTCSQLSQSIVAGTSLISSLSHIELQMFAILEIDPMVPRAVYSGDIDHPPCNA